MAKERVTSNKVFSAANEAGFFCTALPNGQGLKYQFLVDDSPVATCGNSKEAMQWLAGYQYSQDQASQIEELVEEG